MQTRVRAFLDEVAAWAGEQPDVHGVVLLGSQARTDSPADEGSDVDLSLFVDVPDRYLRDDGWLRRFGEPLLSLREPTAVGGFEERRALYRDGLEADFAVLPAAAAETMPPEARAVLARGFRVLYGDAIEIGEASRAEPGPPTQPQLDQLSNDFWYHLLWAAKKLWRGELLLAKQVCDGYLKGLLVELARWRAFGTDTWHGLRFFERWAGDDLVEALGPTFAAYEAADVARALRATGELFAELEDDVAERFMLVSPVDREEVFHRLDQVVSASR